MHSIWGGSAYRPIAIRLPAAVGEHGIACNDLDHALVEQIDIGSKSAIR